MNNKNLKKRLVAFLLVFTFIFLDSGIKALALDGSSVSAGEQVIVNVENFCNPGQDWYSSSAAATTYHYTLQSGHQVDFQMRFVTRDNYSLGEPRRDENGNYIWVYCMEFEEDAYPWVFRACESPDGTSDSVWNSLSAGQRQGITLALLYGYPGSLNGAHMTDSFAATQAIIWEFQTGIRTSATSNTRQAVYYNGRTLPENYFYNIMTVNQNGINAYNSIISKIYKHGVMPNFNVGSKIDMAYDTASGSYKTTLTDSNGVLSDCNVTATDGMSVSVSGNTLTLTSKKAVNGAKLSITKKATPNINQGMLVMRSTGAGQTMLIGQRAVDAGTVFTVNALNGSLKVQKRSSDGIVEGLKFLVVGPGVNTTLTTDKNGVAYLNNVPAGQYKVTEQTPDRYVTQETKTITIQSGQTAVASFSNVVKSGDLIVLKLDSGTGKPVPRAQFELYDEDDNHIATEMTDSEGKATFKGVLYGNYYVFESIAPEGYKLTDKRFHFSITEDKQIVNETFDDDTLMRQFSVYKKGEALVGFEKNTVDGRDIYTPKYEVTYLDGCEVGVYALDDIKTLDGTVRYKKDELVDTLVTSKDGPVYTKDLYEGTYYIKEIKAPFGYVTSDETFEVELYEDDLQFTFENKRQKCALTFKKAMSNTTGAALSTYVKFVSFGVFSAEEINGLPADSLLEVIKPNDEGDCTLSVDLPAGYKYYVKELATADGFILDTNSYFFSFIPADDKTEIFEAVINENNEVVNEMEPVVLGVKTGDSISEKAGLYISLTFSSALLLTAILFKNKKLTSYI